MGRGERGRDLVQRLQPRHLFDHVGLAPNVGAAKGGGLYIQPVGGLLHSELERLENLLAARALDRDPQQAAHASVPKPDCRRLRPRSANIDRPGLEARPTQLDHQTGGDRLGLERLLWLELLLEPGRGLRPQPQLQRGAVDVGAVPVRDLHQHAGGVRADLRAGATHYARDPGRPFLVFDHDHVRVERAELAVEGLKLFSLSRAANSQLPPRHAVEVVRV